MKCTKQADSEMRDADANISEEEEGGAPIAEIPRSAQGRSGRSSMGDVEKGGGRGKKSFDVPKSPGLGRKEVVHVISVEAFKE
jgi:hypothetical protein